MNKNLETYYDTALGINVNPVPFNSVNVNYGWCLLPSTPQNRNSGPGISSFGVAGDNCVPKMIKTPDILGPENTATVNTINSAFLNGNNGLFTGNNTFKQDFGSTDLQNPRNVPKTQNHYVDLASKSLNASPDNTMIVFFSDSNINHLRTTIVQKVKEITSESGVAGNNEGVDIQPPNMDDLFYYMLNMYKNYKVTNGSIVFVNLKKTNDLKSEIAKLNTEVLQEYVSKMISQINMYIYYYQDASQLPEQLSRPTYNRMKGSRELEYNTGFMSGNSLGMSAYNQMQNII
jgi:hypothetical protein